MSGLPALLMELGRAGVEVGADPVDPSRLRYRPAELPPALASKLRAYKPAILSLLVASPVLDEDRAYVLEERLGIAELSGLPVHRGSPAWAIAVAEAGAGVERPQAVATESPNGPRDAARATALIVREALGIPVRILIERPGARFPGEPDQAVFPREVPGFVAPAATGVCCWCRRDRWWRMPGQSVWTCGACHPPAPSLTVERGGA